MCLGLKAFGVCGVFRVHHPSFLLSFLPSFTLLPQILLHAITLLHAIILPTFLFLSLSLPLLGRGRDRWISLSLPYCRWATRERWMDHISLLLLALSSSLFLSLGLLGQGSDGSTFIYLPPSHAFSLPLPHPCSPWARQRWKGSSFLLPSGQGTDRRAFRA